MSIGIAFSGGGVSAAIGAACAWNSIVELHPHVLDPFAMDLTVSTVSGGSIGYGLWTNARERIRFTPYDFNVTLEDLSGEWHDIADPNDNEFASDVIKQWLSPDEQLNVTSSCDKGTRKRVGEIVGELFSPIVFRQLTFGKRNNWSHWWRSIIQSIFGILCVNEIKTGNVPWLTSFAFFIDPANFDKSGRGFLLPSSAEKLHQVIVDMNNSNFEVSIDRKGSGSIKGLTKISALDAIAYSSAFWSSNILTNNVFNLLFNRMLIKSSTTLYELSDAEQLDLAIMDGGVVDTTGIVALLKQRKQIIVAFYNNNVPLELVSSPIAYLFGVDTITDTHNSLKGPVLSQLFSSNLYHDVIRNLTDPNIGVAHLENINIVQNRLGVEPYKILSLTIVSNAKMSSFQFNDERISQRISSRWPDHYPFGLPVLEANALCAFSDYKVKELLKGPNNILQK